ncbi:hypothetical protein [Acinetobacter haemolyticus]|uniref:hypothetical protein n=1 Tax=Acinetobacter haemolyticus TaxID=29430 RepID=UPI000C2C5013|nr:hypothetical protein [Acinetobacter haemolyticus]ATZ66137.1 hypothetical protein BSR56_01390 [Acinetobacter haemolyticus]
MDSSELKTTEAINRLSLFKQTNDKVKAAVAEIAANISEMQNDCPLCGVHHGLDELKNRIAVKLQVIDPALTAMTEFEQECQRDLLENKKNYINALSDFKISIESLKNEESKLRIIEKNIAEISKDPLFKSENIEEVDLSLNKYFENINKEKILWKSI